MCIMMAVPTILPLSLASSWQAQRKEWLGGPPIFVPPGNTEAHGMLKENNEN